MAESMKQTILIWFVALIAAAVAIGQGPGDQATGQSGVQTKRTAEGQKKGQPKAAPRNPAQSPASHPGPQTVTPQTYPIEQIQAGELRFTSQCGFCHGRDAAGGETGPDLTRSELVAEDVRGDKIGPLVRTGRPDQGMPAFDLSDGDVGAIVAFIHDQKTKFEALGGGRRAVDAADLATGDAAAGRLYFNGVAAAPVAIPLPAISPGSRPAIKGLASAAADALSHAASPLRRGRRSRVTLASGQTITGPLASEDEFTIVVLDPAGARQTYRKRCGEV